MNWTNLWLKIFGITEFLDLNMGFWISIVVIILIVILMNIIFWGMKPKNL